MANTPNYAWPYQVLTDAPNGAALGQALAVAADTTVKSIDNRLAVVEPAVATLVAASHVPVAATVSPAQSTASTSYTDLATAGPAVTVTTGSIVLLTLTCGIYNSGGNVSYASCAISGATTVAPFDSRAVQNGGTVGIRVSITTAVGGLTPGSNTFTMKYRAAAGTASFYDREVIVDAR